MRLASRWFPAVLVSAFLVVAGSANAATYCVNAPGCSGINKTLLQDALDAAAASTGVADTVQVGNPGAPGSGYSYSDSGNAANQVSIVGAGPGSTLLTTSSAGTVLTLIGPGSSVSNLTLSLHPGGSTGLLTSGSASNVAVNTADDGTGSQYGLELTGTGSQHISHFSIALQPGSGTQQAILVDMGGGSALFDDLSVDSADYGLIAIPTTNVTIHRGSFLSGYGLLSSGAHINADNLVFRQAAGVPGSAFLLASAASGNDATVNVNHASGFGDGTADSIGAYATSIGSGDHATVNLTNSIMRRFGHTFTRSASSSGIANVTLSYSDFELTGISDANSSGGTGSITPGPGSVFADPQWVNPSAGNFALQPSSPVINAGDPAGLAAGESLTDVLGQPRVSGGRTDMGAVEFQSPVTSPPAPPDLIAPNVSIGKLKAKLRLKKLVSGFTFTLNPSEPSSFDVTLRGSAGSAHLAKSYNLVLSHKKLPLKAGKRTVRMKVKKRLLGRSRKFSVKLTVVAKDAAGNSRTVSRVLKVKR